MSVDESECPHLHTWTYTYRDWWETGIPEGTVCEDCGKEFTQEEVEAERPTS